MSKVKTSQVFNQKLQIWMTVKVPSQISHPHFSFCWHLFLLVTLKFKQKP